MSKPYIQKTHNKKEFIDRRELDPKPSKRKESYADFLKEITPEDLERILCREFTEQDQEEARDILSNYGLEPSHKEILRVRLAALRLSDGNLQMLEDALDLALESYQDALCAAETPTYRKIPANMPKEDVELVLEEDYSDYKEWVLWDA